MALYLIVAFAWSWGLAAIAWQTGIVKMPFVENDPGVFVLLVLFMCGPAVGALFAAAREGRMKEALRFRLMPNAWWLLAWLIPVIILADSYAIALLIPGVAAISPAVETTRILAAQGQSLPMNAEDFTRITLIAALTLGAFINMFGTLTEELGWRGYMLGKMQGLGFWTRHLTIGFVWGLWHAPIIVAGFNYPGEPISGPIMFVGFCMLMAPIIGFVSERGRSVLAAGLFHGTINAAAPISVMALTGAGVWERAIVGWPGLLVMALACALIGVLRLDRD